MREIRMASATMARQITEDPQTEETPKLHFLTPLELFMDRLLSCKPGHKWGFPVTSLDMKRGKAYEYPYDSHQACTTCGRTRFFDSSAWVPGPVFEKR
jgi:hypothetical protein